MRRAITACFLLVLILGQAAQVTPFEYLAAQTKPVFKPSHTLPILTYSGWFNEPTNVVVELAQHWGYAVENFGSTTYSISQMTTPGSALYLYTQLVLSDTNRYKAAVHCQKFWNRYWLPQSFTNQVQPETDSLFSKASYFTNSAGEFLDRQGVASPYFGYIVTDGVTNNHAPAPSVHAPNEDWARITACQVELFKMVNSNCPISVILDDGEWGVEAYTTGWRAAHQDPGYVAALAARGVTLVPGVYNASREILLYNSEQAGRILSHFPAAFATNFPNAKFYYYQIGMEKYRYGSATTASNYNNGNAFDARYLLTNYVMPSTESYWRSGNTGMTNGYTGSGLVIGQTSIALQHENFVGNMIKYGYPLSYNYVAAGYGAGSDPYMPAAHYAGWLKCMYVMGTVGVNAGWYGPSDIDDPFDENEPAEWLNQKIIASRVHAQFSWLEDYIWNGSLVAGPYTNLMSQDNMSYDFNQGTNGANKAHVYVRKLDEANDWLVTAWTADSTNSNVTVDVPTLGEITVTAAPSGNLYRFTDASNPMLLDEQGRHVFRKEGHAESLFVR